MQNNLVCQFSLCLHWSIVLKQNTSYTQQLMRSSACRRQCSLKRVLPSLKNINRGSCSEKSADGEMLPVCQSFSMHQGERQGDAGDPQSCCDSDRIKCVGVSSVDVEGKNCAEHRNLGFSCFTNHVTKSGVNAVTILRVTENKQQKEYSEHHPVVHSWSGQYGHRREKTHSYL